MKKIIFVLCALLLSASLFAQFDLGVRLGANYPYLGTEDFEQYLDVVQDPGNINGYMAGVFVGVGSDNFRVQIEANAPLEGFSIERLISGDSFSDVVTDTDVNLDFLNTLFMLRYEINLLLVKPYVGAGVNVGFPLVETNTYMLPFDIANVGYAFSVGVMLLDFIDVDVRYISGTTNLSNNDYIVDHPYFGEQVRLSLGVHIF